MNKLLLLIIYILLFSAFTSLNAQVFPYLNASTGNENQYVIDADTNIYMFHGNQLEKVDKHFNPIWVKTYDGLDFYSLLLSTTGSIYFIAKNEISYAFMNTSYRKYVGKLDNSGNVAWIKTIENPSLTQINVRSLLLDRNNKLMISGEGNMNMSPTALLLKLDTLGNILHCNHFTGTEYTGLSNVTLLNDSAGYYTCIYSGNFFESSAISMFTYCEAGDSIYSESYIGEYPQHYMIGSAGYYKSRKNTNVYYSISQHGIHSPEYINVRKYDKNNVLWNRKFPAYYTSDFSVNSFDEDENKSIFFTIAPNRGPGDFHTGFYSRCFKLDSNGVFSGHYNTLLNYSWWPPSSQRESAKLTVLNNNKFFFDVTSRNFPLNPLSVTFLDSLLTTNCSTSTALTMTNSVSIPIQHSEPLLTTYVTSPYMLADYVANTTVISDFAIDPNYCLALNTREAKLMPLTEIMPNPAKDEIRITFPADQTLTSVNIFNVNGALILTKNASTITISSLSPGMYFIRLLTNRGEFYQKFVKE